MSVCGKRNNWTASHCLHIWQCLPFQMMASSMTMSPSLWPLHTKQQRIFYAPRSNDRGHIVFVLSVCLSVVNFNLRYKFWTLRGRDFIFFTLFHADASVLFKHICLFYFIFFSGQPSWWIDPGMNEKEWYGIYLLIKTWSFLTLVSYLVFHCSQPKD